MDLKQCLESTPHRSLAAIAAAQRMVGYRGLSKADLMSLLSERLSSASWRNRTLQRLEAREMEALRHLSTHDGCVPRSAMEQRFGAIRPYRPWRPDSPHRPWLDPISPAESLHYKGLIYPLASRDVAGGGSVVVLPEEFRGPLTDRRVMTEGLPDHLAGEKPPFRPLLDMTLLLVYLQQHDVAPIHGRWLGPHHFRRLGACLNPPVQISSARTELQTGRLPFIHYLAEALGLLALTGNTLKPAPGALAWLRQPRQLQHGQLWQSWLSADDENRQRWRRYRLPGAKLRDPVGFALRFLELLSDWPVGSWLAGDGLTSSGIAGLDMLLPWWERDNGESAGELAAALLGGPLAWLGVVHRDQQHPDATPWRLSSFGKALIAGDLLLSSATPQPLALDPHLRLEIPDDPPLDSLLALADWAELEPGQALRLSQGSVSRAIARGYRVENLLSVLPRLVDPVPTAQQRKMLLEWETSPAPLRIMSTLLLQTATSAQMTTLRGDRALRPHLGQQLAANLVVVRTSKPHHLRRLLARRGQIVVADKDSRHAGDEHTASPNLDSGAAYWLAVAARLQTDLAHRFGIIAAPPGAVLDQLSAALNPAQRTAVEADVTAALARLAEAIADRPPRLSPMPEEDVVALLQDALDSQGLLTIRYWSPWEAQESRRTIRPLGLEWRGDHRYLEAYCHLAGAKRTFRLDRILAVAPCTDDHGPAAG